MRLLKASYKLNFSRIIINTGWKIRLLEVKFGLILIMSSIEIKFPWDYSEYRVGKETVTEAKEVNE